MHEGMTGKNEADEPPRGSGETFAAADRDGGPGKTEGDMSPTRSVGDS